MLDGKRGKMIWIILILIGGFIMTNRKILSAEETRYIIEDIKGSYPELAYIPTSLILGFIKTESGFNINAKSWVGAKGLMQIMPAAYNDMLKFYHIVIVNTSLYDPVTNIMVGMFYIHWLYSQTHDWDITIQAYNTGLHAVRDLGKTAITYMETVREHENEYV